MGTEIITLVTVHVVAELMVHSTVSLSLTGNVVAGNCSKAPGITLHGFGSAMVTANVPIAPGFGVTFTIPCDMFGGF